MVVAGGSITHTIGTLLSPNTIFEIALGIVVALLIGMYWLQKEPGFWDSDMWR